MANTYLTVDSIIEKNKIASAVAWVPLMALDVIDPASGNHVETLRFAQNTESVTFEGNVYDAARFTLDIKHESGSQPEIQLNAVDYTRTIQKRMQDYGGGIGFRVTVFIVNTDNLAAGPEISETFTVTRANQKDYAVSFTLSAENPLNLRLPRRRQYRDRCQWVYKSAECGYTGSMPDCDFTLDGPNGCKAHGNAHNFGGFPGIREVV